LKIGRISVRRLLEEKKSRSELAYAGLPKGHLEVKYQQLEVFPPIGKQKKYPSLTLTVIHALTSSGPKV
jgi:hypothetical protein